MKKLSMLILMVLLITLTYQVVYPQGVQWSTFSSGGNVSTTSGTQLVSIVGQQFVGESNTSTTHVASGFLAGKILSPILDVNLPATLPMKFELMQNYPNPFNPSTAIKYELQSDSRVKLAIYNTLGQVIATLLDEIQPAGFKSATWIVTDIPSGVYFYRLEATSTTDPGKTFTQVKKMLLVK